MDVYEVVKRGLADPAFAAELHQQALRASRKEATTDEWVELLAHFVDSPRELYRLNETELARELRATTTTTTTTTTTSVTSPVCTLTTLTTVTTWFRAIPNEESAGDCLVRSRKS
jgi:hypothetical protein